jgi:hypothetical protein
MGIKSKASLQQTAHYRKSLVMRCHDLYSPQAQSHVYCYV